MDWLTALRSLWRDFSSPPVWGVSDCMQFASRYVHLLTGIDHASQFTYHDKAGALRLLAEYEGIVNLVSARVGKPHGGDALPGDLVIGDIGRDGEMLTTGVYNGVHACVIHPDYGLVRALPHCIKHAWTF